MEYLKSPSIRVPGVVDKVFKDECVYCFDSPVRTAYMYMSFKIFYVTCRCFVVQIFVIVVCCLTTENDCLNFRPFHDVSFLGRHYCILVQFLFYFILFYF